MSALLPCALLSAAACANKRDTNVVLCDIRTKEGDVAPPHLQSYCSNVCMLFVLLVHMCPQTG
jgi:hypothetical protein